MQLLVDKQAQRGQVDKPSVFEIARKLTLPATPAPGWTQEQLSQFISAHHQLLHYNSHHPRVQRESLINYHVKPAVLNYALEKHPGYSWAYISIDDEARKSRASGRAFGQIPNLLNAPQDTYYVGVALLTAGHDKPATLRIPIILKAQGTLLEVSVVEQDPIKIALAHARGPAHWKLQAPAESEAGRWASLLQSEDGETPYLKCGEINDGFNFPLGVPSTVVAGILEAAKLTHALLPYSRRDPGFLIGQDGEYLKLENGSLHYTGEVLNENGELCRASVILRFSVELDEANARLSKVQTNVA